MNKRLDILKNALIPLHGEEAIKNGLALLLRRGLAVDLSSVFDCSQGRRVR
ncbi:MAG: hypothetical protein ACXW1Z_20185 [Methylobacter sp.]